jgi:hypothetical protein
MKPHERIDSYCVNVDCQRMARPPRELNVRNLVESIEVPYVIDEEEYLARLAARDRPREEAKEKRRRFRVVK